MQLNICPPLCLSFHLSIGLAQCCANYPSSVDCWKSHFSSCRKHRIEWLNGSKIQFSGSVKIFILAFCSFVLSFIHLEKAKYRQAKREWNLCLWGGVAVSWQLFVSHSTVLSITQYPCVVVVVFFFLICFVLVDQECSQVCPPGLTLRREDFFSCNPTSSAFPYVRVPFPKFSIQCWGSETWVLLRFVPHFKQAEMLVTVWTQELLLSSPQGLTLRKGRS